MEPDLQKELADTFRAEAAELLAALQRNLLALEKTDGLTERRRLLAQLFRDCHSLKGSAGTLGFAGVERVAHQLEGTLHQVQRGDARIGSELADAILGALDAIRAALDPGAETGAQVEGAVAALERAVGPVAPLLPHRPTQLAGEARPPEEDIFGPPALPQSPPPLPREPAAPAGAEEALRVPTADLDALQRRVEDVATAELRAERRLSEVREVAALLDLAVARLRQAETKKALLDPLLLARRRAERAARELSQDVLHLELVTGALAREAAALRMLPAAAAFEPLRRLARDLARRLGKEVRLLMTGGEVRLDKRVLEQIRTPLVHLIRNAVAHGAELPEERIRLGKEPECTVEVGAEPREGAIAVWVADDGRGVDPAEIRDAAVRRGLLSLEEATRLDTRRAVDLIFAAGFSVKDAVDELSGRGVGLDVVRQNAARLGGRVEVETAVGKGSRFTLVIPLTMTTVRGLFVRAAGNAFAVPISSVDRIARFAARAVAPPGNTIVLEGRTLPVVRLAEALGLSAPSPALPSDAPLVAVVLAAGDRRAAFVVDEVDGEGELILKSLGSPLLRVPNLAGATVGADGAPVPVLDAAALVLAAAPDNADSRVRAAARSSYRALVVDDSVSTRTFLARLLQGAGLDVITAADGAEALDLLEASGCDVVVSDVDMPGLDGLGLVRRLRAHPTLKELPVVLVSALGEDVEKAAGLQAGADAYIAKREFESGDVIRVVQRLIAARG